jgi:hypothetical protein
MFAKGCGKIDIIVVYSCREGTEQRAFSPYLPMLAPWVCLDAIDGLELVPTNLRLYHEA